MFVLLETNLLVIVAAKCTNALCGLLSGDSVTGQSRESTPRRNWPLPGTIFDCRVLLGPEI